MSRSSEGQMDKRGRSGPPLIFRTPKSEDNPRTEVFDGEASAIHGRVQARGGSGVDAYVMRPRDLDEQSTVAPMILGVDEGGASIDTPLCDMKRNVRDEQARAAWHSKRLGGRTVPSSDGSAVVVIGITARARVRKRRISNE